ncbi:semaphorin-7A [Dendropsophus ebraccatus]|uniref:semaphorin-7A n=1 Tax=Dendropsophus ebraccatus TaxID=150705 RepID=UPI0038310A35
MKQLVRVLLNLCALLSISLASIWTDPRLTHYGEGERSFPLPKEEAHAFFYLSEDNSLYVGGEEILYHFNLKAMKDYKNYTIKAESTRCQGRPYCKNDVTFVGQLLGKLTVCGTNAYSPGCWVMENETFQKLTYSWAQQLAPRTPVDNYNILISGSEVYSTLARKSNNGLSVMITTFRKLYGSDQLLYTGDTFLRRPKFVKSLVVEKEDKIQNKILLFFTEDNTESRTVEKRLPMVAQLCKSESGSVSANTRNVFSTALKSRMICGNQLTGQYYPHLQDIYFLQGKTGNVIFGLFKNAWDHSAVCSYEVEDIELLFNTSSLFGSSRKDLKIRPGTCLPPPQMTPEETSEEASNYPELTDWLWPSGNKTVFQNLNLYSKIVVDEITAVNQKIYKVLLLATDDGTVHKVVELEDGALNILNVIPFKQKGKLQFMELDPKEHVVYMGTTREISVLPLDDCTAYNTSCTDCVRSRDPFCGWVEGKCESVLKHKGSIVQNLEQDAACKDEKESTAESTSLYLKGNRPTSSNGVYFLTCPTMLKHATYMWKNGDREMGKCDPSNDICELIVNEVSYPGEYKCIVKEMETERALLKYTLPESNSATKPQCLWLLGLTILLLVLA